MRSTSNTREGRNTIMCNYCNRSTNSTTDCNSDSNSCGCNNACNSCCGLWKCIQQICRDSCGNIRVRQSSCCLNGSYNCGCSSCCLNNGCNNSYGNSGTSSSNYGCSGFTDLSLCGNSVGSSPASAARANTDSYYARQYGLLGGRSCPCSAGYNYDIATQIT